MSRGPVDIPVRAKEAFDSALVQANIIFERQLEPLGLSKSQIEKQGLHELENALERINDAINHPESFGAVKLKFVGEVGVFAITNLSSEANFEIGILPLLIERKKLILEKISLLKQDEKIDNLRDLISGLSDENLKNKLEHQLDNLETEAKKPQERPEVGDDSRAQEQIQAAIELAKIQQVTFDKKAKYVRSFFERESVASVIGALLLLAIAIAQITAMFMKLPSTEIVNNAFLLILGYFFGQTASKSEKDG